ncbi:MAG: response regulator [Chloroflexota bacterium]
MVADAHRVLILEDDREIATVLSDTLSDEGYDIRCAANGQEGLAILSQWVPHLILLDLTMPVMDGRSFRDAQRNLTPPLADLPVIVLSGTRDVRAQAEYMAAAAAIAKPFELEDVLNTVARICESTR